MSDNKTKPSKTTVESFLNTLSDQRQGEAQILIKMMQEIADSSPCLWGPSIVGFGTKHYSYDSGREGDMPQLSFSPRKAAITIYFTEGFDRYATQLDTLGVFTNSVSCLYIRSLSDVNLEVLKSMLIDSYNLDASPLKKPTSVEDYASQVPKAAQSVFQELRTIVQKTVPEATEVISYGIIGYSCNGKRPLVYISGWKDHVAMYPIPKDPALTTKLKPYIKGKGTLWFRLDMPLPTKLIQETIKAY